MLIATKVQAAVLFLMAFLPAPAYAEEPTAVRAMMQDSGIVEQFSDLGEQFGEQFGRASAATGAAFPADLVAPFAEIVTQALNGERFLDDLEDALAESLSADEIAAMTGFYRTPVGKDVKRLEVESSSSVVRADIEANRAALLAELKANPERLAVIERLDKALLASELSATVAANLMYAVAVGAAEARPQGATADDLTALGAAIDKMHPALVAEMRETMQTTFARTYRDLSEDDLAAYVAFLETVEARAVYAGFYAAVNEIFENRGREIGEAFGALLAQKRT